jgi:ABC-type transport system involved in multi-copper enzyme maturation permease subunit
MIGEALIRGEMLNLARAPRTYTLRFAAVFVLTCMAALAWPWHKGAPGFAAAGQAVFQCVFWAEMVAACLLVPALVAPAIAGEREKNTLDLLSVAPITEFEIVFGKLVANSALAGAILLAGLPVGFAALLMGGVAPSQALVCAVGLLLSAVFAASLAIAFSAVTEKSGIATGATIIVHLTLVIASLFAGTFVLAFASGRFRGPLSKIPGAAVIPEALFHGICPWSLYVREAVTDPMPWPVRLVAWSTHLLGSFMCLLFASWALRGRRSPKDRRAKARPAPAPLPAPPPRVAALPMPPLPLPADGIPMALMPAVAPAVPMALLPAAIPPLALPAPPQENWWKYRHSMKSRLPIGPNPILWKETTFRRDTGQQVLSGLASVASFCVLLMSVGMWLLMLMLASGSSKSLVDHRTIQYSLLFDLVTLTVLAVGAGSSTLGPEREAGTLALLVATGRPSGWILKAKLLAAARSLRIFLALLALRLLWLVFALPWAAPGIILAFLLTGAVATSLSVAFSLLAGNPRRAALLSWLSLLALWGVPAILAVPFGVDSGLAQFNPFALVALLITDVLYVRPEAPRLLPWALYAWCGITALLSAALLARTAWAIEGRVRA